MIFPPAYRPSVPDVELVLMDMIATELAALTPTGWVGTFWPSDKPDDVEALIAAGKAVVRVHKLPGVLEVDGHLHVTETIVEVRSSTRAASWAVLQYLDDQLTAKYDTGGVVPRSDGTRTVIKGFGTSSTGQQLDFFVTDDRLVQSTFQVAFKRNLHAQ